MRIMRFSPELTINLPISGGAAIAAGAILKRGLTSYLGSLVTAGGASAIPDTVGILRAAHATADDTVLAGTKFTKKPVEVTMPYRIIRCEYSQATADTVAATQAVSTTTITLTSLEDDIDAAFLYVAAGLGAGQTNYLTAAAAGSATLKAAFATSLDTTSYLVKVLPRFHKLLAFNTAGTKLLTAAAAGAVKGFVLDSWIERDGNMAQLDPTKHAALTGLAATGRDTHLWADICVTDSGAYPVA